MIHRRHFLSLAAASFAAPLAAAASNPRIRIGQIGTVHGHASAKMATLRKLSDLYEVVGIVEPDPDQRARAQTNKAYDGLPWLTEEQLLNTPGLRAVAIETGVADLVPTGHRAVKAGMHIHLDKPAGHSLPAFQALLRDAARQNLTVQLGYMLRYNHAMQRIYQAAANGYLGSITHMHGEMAKLSPAERPVLAPFHGGHMFEIGGHIIDSMLHIMAKPARVTPFLHRTQPDDNVADNCLSVLQWDNAFATVRTSVVDPAGSRRRHFLVGGTNGTAEIRPLEPPTLTLHLASAAGPYKRGEQTVELPKTTGRYDGEFLDLAAILQGQKAPDFSPRHDLDVQQTLLRASDMPLT